MVPGQKYSWYDIAQFHCPICDWDVVHTQEVAEKDPQSQEESREGAEFSPEAGAGGLGYVDGGGGNPQPHPQPTDGPPSQHRPVPVGCGVRQANQQEGGEEDEAGEKDGVLSSQKVE